MASGTPAKVRITAPPGSDLYQLQLSFNALVAWCDTHTHTGANPVVPTAGPVLVSKIGGPDGRDAAGAVVSA